LELQFKCIQLIHNLKRGGSLKHFSYFFIEVDGPVGGLGVYDGLVGELEIHKFDVAPIYSSNKGKSVKVH
jgi:hypothetical protein